MSKKSWSVQTEFTMERIDIGYASKIDGGELMTPALSRKGSI